MPEYHLVHPTWRQGDEPAWHFPSSVGVVDLRSLSQHAPGNIHDEQSVGWAFAAYGRVSDAPPNSLYLGQGGDLSAGMLSGLRQELSLGESIVARRPMGVLFEILTGHADMDVDARWGGLVPTMRLELELWFGNVRVVQQRFDISTHPHAAKVRELHQAQYRDLKVQADGGEIVADFHRRMLSVWMEKYRTKDYEQFIPGDLPSETPRLHESDFSESFNQGDSSTLGPVLTWAETLDDMETISNRATHVNVSTRAEARAEHDVSSTDHETESTVRRESGAGTRRIGVDVRYSSSARTFYEARVSIDEDEVQLRKFVAGSLTELGTPPAIGEDFDTNTDYLLKCQINGTTLKSFFEGSEKESITDSSISAGTRGGMSALHSHATAKLFHDAWSVADLAAPGITAAEMMAALQQPFGQSQPLPQAVPI